MSDDGSRVVVIGVGNEFRRDDGAGLEVLEQLRRSAPDSVELVRSDGEPARLVEAWTGADLAVVIDAIWASPAEAGRTHRIVIDGAGPGQFHSVSSHGLGVGDAIGLARALDRMPARLVVHAIEVRDVGYGVGLSPAVAAAAQAVTVAVLTDLSLRFAGECPSGRATTSDPASPARIRWRRR